ncbi:MAG: DUF438 domain-containing protein [Parafannyhessea sp.]|uniref:DUF438 domain-containing protein n=1 Tax=Parafannyhessea sp. TaxID=2847324 RepID=UPI003EFDC916
MAKYLDLNKSVHDLVEQYPEIVDVMVSLGFTEMAKPVALNSVGRVMTIPKGAQVKGIPLDRVLATLEDNGFSVEGKAANPNPKPNTPVQAAPTDSQKAAANPAGNQAADGVQGRQQLLQSYVARLSAGEPLEDVRTDFVANFENVDAAEIARAEQTLIEGGAKIEDVQRLCDVHSALFHGATKEEKIANAEKAVMDSLATNMGTGSEFETKVLTNIPGHPVRVFSLENDAIGAAVAAARKALGTDAEREQIAKLQQVGIHYSKKGDLLYPILKVNHGYSGPADVMWGVDDEIRHELRYLASATTTDDAWRERAEAVFTRAEEMVYKEANILLPLCVDNFTDDEWLKMYFDLKGYDLCMVDAETVGVWQTGEKYILNDMKLSSSVKGADGKDGGIGSLISLPSGNFTPEQLDAMLNTIPLEITFIDDEEVNRYWNDDGEKKLFKRPASALGRKVWNCHPPKVQQMVKGVINTLKTTSQKSVDIWMEKGGEPVLVRYMAVRDREGKYVGTMECVQRMGFAKEHFLG